MRAIAVLSLLAWGAFCGSAGAQSRQLMNFEEAKQRADQGDAFAQAVVATHYQLGWNTEKNPELAAKYALASANAGEALGQFRLGALLREGVGVPKDEQQGLNLQGAAFDSLYSAQDPYSMTAAGIMIFQGKVIGQNISQDERRKDAAALYKKAADMGYAPAQFNYAMCADAGHGIAKNTAIALEYVQRAAAGQYPLAKDRTVEDLAYDASLAAVRETTDMGKSVNTLRPIVQDLPSEPVRSACMLATSKAFACLAGRDIFVFSIPAGRLVSTRSCDIPNSLYPLRIFGSSSDKLVFISASENADISSERFFSLGIDDGKLSEIKLPVSGIIAGFDPHRKVVAVLSQAAGRVGIIEVDVTTSDILRNITLESESFGNASIVYYNINGELLFVNSSMEEMARFVESVEFIGGGSHEVFRPTVKVHPTGGRFCPYCKTVHGKDFAEGFSSTEWSDQDITRVLSRLLEFNRLELNRLEISDSLIAASSAIRQFMTFEEALQVSTSPNLLVANVSNYWESLVQSHGIKCLDLSGFPPSEHVLEPPMFVVSDGLSCSGDGDTLALWSSSGGTYDAWGQVGILKPASRFTKPLLMRLSDFSVRPLDSPYSQVWNLQMNEKGDLAILVGTDGFGVDRRMHRDELLPDGSGITVNKVSVDASILDLRNDFVVSKANESQFIQPFCWIEGNFVDPAASILQTAAGFSNQRFVYAKERWTVTENRKKILSNHDPDRFSSANVSGLGLGLGLSQGASTGDNLRDATNEVATRWVNEGGGSGKIQGNVYCSLPNGLLFRATLDGQRILAAYPVGQNNVVVATTRGVFAWDLQKNLLNLAWESPRPSANGSFKSFAFGPSSGTLFYLNADSSVSKLKVSGGQTIREEVRLFPQIAGPPLFVTPDNFYSIPSGSIRGIHFSDGDKTYPFEQFDLRLNRPDIVLERLGAPAEAVAIAKQLREKRIKRMGVTEEMLKPDFHVPELEIVGEVPSATDDNQINVAIKASDSKYPLERLKVYVNNVPVNGRDGELLRQESKSGGGLLGRLTGAFTKSSTGPQTLERTVPIKLSVGRNKIQVSVVNNAGAESLYANAEINCTAKRPKPTLYAVAMGVSEYSNPDWNLKYAAKDARDVLARLKDKAGDQYGEVKELLLTDKDVTKENLAKVREFLKGATIDDTVLMFAAGHGLLDSKYDYYFGTTDIDFNNPSDKGIAFEEFDDILADLPCLKKSLLVDTCHAGELDQDEKALLASADSGGSAALPTGKGIAMRSIGTRGMNVKAIEGARGASEWYDRLQGLFVDLRRGSGSTILTSAAGAEYALESSEQQNGLFTYAVLEALDGKPDADTNKDGSVQMSELGEYVKKRVSELTNNKQTPNTRRVNLEGDFTLAKTR